MEKGYNKIKEDLENVLGSFNKKKDKETIERITSLVNINLESLKETWSFEDIDSYMPYFYDEYIYFFRLYEGCIYSS